MQNATAQAIEENATVYAQDWSYRGTLNGTSTINAGGGSDTVLYVEHDGKEYIVGSGDVSFGEPDEYMRRRAKENVGDMLVCLDPLTGEIAYLPAKDVYYSREMSSDELKEARKQQLQQINSVPYNQAAQEQAAAEAAKPQPKEEAQAKETVTDGNQSGQPQKENAENFKVANSLQGKVGGSLSKDEAESLVSEMEARPEKARDLPLTPENWKTEFGENGEVNTPLGVAKMGENQLAKMFMKGREAELGLVKPTLENPDVIIEEASNAKDGDAERPSSYLFVKTFERDGKKIKFYASVSVKKDGMEVVVSNHFMNKNAVDRKLQEGKVLYIKGMSSSNSSDMHLAEHPNGGSDLLPTPESDIPTGSKDTNNSPNGNENGENLTFEDGNPVPMTKDSKGRPTPDYANMKPEQAAEILGKQFGESAEKVVDGQIKKAEKAVKDAEKMKVDYTAEPNDILEQEQQKKAGADAAKKQLEHAQATKKAMTQKKVAETVAKPEGEAAEGANEASGAVAEKFANATRLVGNKRTRTLANSEKISGHYEIVPAESLTPSHDAMNGYRKSEGFPVDENGRTVNDRDYENDKAAQQNTDQMALKYNGQAIDQVPVVSDEGIVYDGNGRTMAGQKAAKDGTDGEYISDLLDNAENFGFTREQIEKSGIEHPRLVLVTDERMPYDTATFAKFNRNEKKTQSNTEQAVAKAKTLTADEVGSIVADIEGNGSLDAFFNNPKAINDLVKTLVSKGIIGQNEVAELMEGTDRLSPQGKELVKNLLLGSIFKPETIRMMGIDSAIKNKAIAGIRAVMDNMKLGDYSLRDEIDQAVQLLYEARQNGDNVDTLLRTPAMFGENAANRYPSVSQMMALALEGKVSDFRDLLNEYNREAAAHNTGEGDVFGDVPTKEELIRDFLNYKKWKDYDTRGNSEAEGGNDAEGVRKTEPEAQGGNGGSKPTEGQRQVDEAVKKLATDITKQTGVTVHTDEKESQKALEDAEKKGSAIRKQTMIGNLAKAANVIKGWLSNNKRNKSFTIELPNATVKLIRKALGRDFDEHLVTANSIAHAKSNHGVNGKKITDKSIPLRDEDFELLPYIMTAPTRVERGSFDATGRESIRFIKEISNGNVLVVEKEQRNSPDDMETITMWAEKSSSNVADALSDRGKSPAIDARNVIISTEDAAKIRKDAELAIENDVKLREQRVYHGSAAGFDHFDHSHMGEGEGAQAYGWGTYVTEVEGIGRTYAKNNTAKNTPKDYRAASIEYEEYRSSVEDGEYEVETRNEEIEKLEAFLNGLKENYKKAKEKGLSYRYEDFENRIKNEEKVISERKEKLKIVEATLAEDKTRMEAAKARLDSMPKPERHLYTVEIPDDTGDNYLEWDKKYTQKETDNLLEKLFDAAKDNDEQMEAVQEFSNWLLDDEVRSKDFYQDTYGRAIYNKLTECLGGSNRKASELLHKAGFTGVKVIAQRNTGGNKDGKMNYVIFNEGDAKITDHVRFFRTKDGEAYGFVVDGEIHLDTKKMKPETPLHEYTHLWTSALQRVNAKEWENVKSLLDSVDGLKEEVQKLYPELEGDDLYDEMLATYSGREGTKKLEAEARRLAAEEGKTVTESARAKSFLGKVKEALKRYWNGVADMLGIHFTSAEEVADKVLADWASGVNPNEVKGGADPMASLRRNAEEYNNKVRMQKADEVEATAREHGVDATWLGRYAEGMREKNSAMAVMAMRDMKALYLRAHTAEKKALMEREGISGLIANKRLFEPIAKAIKAKYGDVDVLVEERRKQVEIERGMMEAARKRAEEEQLRREARLEELAQLTDEDVDKRYAEALEKGDEATAREMLDEAARRKGYGDAESDYQGVGAWSAPTKPDYESDEARRNAVGEDTPNLNIEDMAAGYSNQPMDVFVHPEKYSQGLPTSKASGEAIQKAIDAIKQGDKDVKVKVYRAVPTSVKEGKLRNGDWVTPNRAYAELHGNSRFDGKYRIIEDEVPAKELWWDSNDVNEWGYDNGKDYRYKNAKNNRKLNDLVTRDDKGNVIPPSKRFNSRKADERYQKADSKAQVDKREAALRDAVVEKLRKGGMDVSMDAEEGQRVLDEANGRAKPQMGDASETFAARQKQAVEDKGVVMPNLNEASVKVVNDIPRHNYQGSIADATRQAIDAAKQKYVGKVQTYNNYGEKFDYTISGNAIETCLSPKHQGKSVNKGVHLALAEHIDEVIDNSIEVEEHPDYVKVDGERGNDNSINPDALMHRFYGVAVVDGTPYRIMTLMREDIRKGFGNGIHSYEVQKIEMLDNELPSISNGVGTPSKNMNAYPLAKLLKGIEKAHDKGKFLLDESEKRSKDIREQRVYHGSGADSDHVRFFRTEDDEAYGYTIGGKIYIDPRIASSETPIHEYAHLWATALRNGNAKEWENVVGLMRDTKVWDEVKRKYPELEADDDIADEVLATYSGRRGAERLRKEMGEADGNAKGALERVKQAIRKFWKATADMLHIHYTSAEEVADRVMKDLLDGMDPREFGAVSEKVRKQFIGERGAEKADHAEEVNTRLENLRVARNMETAGKDAKAIKMATGWERGADGKWRYEIQDIKYHPKGDAEYNKLRDKQPWAKELGALEDRLFDGDQLTEDESKRFDELAEQENKFKADFLSHEKNRLADWVENKELFEAYPELKNVEMVFTDQLPKNEGGYYSEKDNRLVVNTAFDMDNIESVIAHELQHAIQRMEGFARGGSAEGVEREFQKAKAEWAARAYAHQLEETAKELGEDYSQAEVEKALVKEYEEMGMSDWLPDGETRIKGFNYFARGYADRSLDDAIKRFRLNESTRADFNPYLEYRKLAGEVESRNVQNRMSMTPAERRASLASETEDVAREDQVFLNGSDDANPMDALARAAEEYHDGQRAKLQKKNMDKDGRDEELFVSLRNKKGKEYYDTVTELARRMAERTGEISRTERAEGNVSEGQGNQWEASLGRNSDGRGRRYKSVVHCAAEIIAADIKRNAGDGLLPRPSKGMERGQEDVGIHSASSSSVEISPSDISSVGVDAPVEREVSKRIENWAKRNNAWLDRRSLRAKYDRTKRLGTGDEAESDVFLSNDGKSVLKIVRNPHIIYRTLLGKLDGVALQNRIFTDDIQNVIGVTRVHEEGVATVGLVLEQPFVDGKPVGKTFRTYEEVKHHIDTFMKSLGFKPELYMAKDGYLKGEKCEVWRKGDIIVDDVHGNNVLIDVDGKNHVIDCSAYNIDEWDKNYEPYKKDSGTHFRMELGKTFSNSKEDFDGVRDRAVEENGIVMPNLNKERVKVVSVPEHGFSGGTEKELREAAEKWGMEHLVTKADDTLPTMRDGTPYSISKKAIGKYVDDSAIGKSNDVNAHLSVLKELKNVIKESIEAEIHPDYNKNEDGDRHPNMGHTDNVLIHRLYGAANINGKIFRVKTTMQEFRGANPNRPHSFEVTKIELLDSPTTEVLPNSSPLDASTSSENELSNSSGTAVKSDSSPLSKTSDDSISVAKLLNGVEKSYDAGKKLLDESKDLTDGETSFRTINNSSETEGTSAASTIVADHVEKVSAKVGSKVRMVNSADEVTNPAVKARLDKGEKVTGWYDEKTGEVHLYMPNIHDRYTAEKTIWHETVGHKAMRGLIGDDNYSKFLRSIWYDLDKPENARLKELVSEELKYNPFDFENAVEEGIARLVEDGKGEVGFWNNIRNKVADIFRSIGYHIAPNTKDVKYLLWLSKNLQKHPNNPYWKMKAEAVRYRLEHEKYTTVKNGMFADNDGKVKDYSDFTRKDWEEATNMTVHFRTTPAAATEIEIYNRAVGNVKAMAEEAYSDKMNSVLELYKAIDPSIKRAEDVKTSENPYMKENLMSSRAQQVGNAFVRDYMEPATKALGDVLDSFSGSDLDEKMRNANLYIVKKSGLERNRVFFVRDQIRKLSKKEETQADAKQLQADWDAEHQTLKGELDNKQITLKEYFDGLDDFIRKNIDDKYKAGEHDYSGFHEMQGVDYNDAIDDAQIQDEVMSAESSIGDSRKVDELWRTINAATDYSLDMEYSGGFMDSEMNQYVKGEMNWYVPMRLFDKETAEDVYGYVNDNGGSTGFVGPALMKAKGRKSLSNLNILAQIGVMGEHAINRAARNGIKQAFMRFVNNNEKAPVEERLVTEVKPWFEKVVVGGVETWEERYPQIPEDATPLEISQAVAKFESDMKTKEANGDAKQGTRRDNINYKFADKAHRPQHIVDVWVNGKKKSYVINGNPRAAQAINGMLDHKSVNNWFSISNRWLSQVCTSYNPEFTLRNTIRDFGFATHTLLGKEGAAYTMKFEKHYAALGFAPIINAAKGVGNGSLKDVKNALAISLFKQYKNGTLDVTKSKYHKWFKEFMDNGGETGYLQMKNVDAWKKQIENDIKDMHKGKLKKLHPIKAVGGFVEDMNEMAENIARFATFCASRESGRNVTRAAYDAKEVSVNFNRSGSAENVRSYKYENMSGKAEKARAAFGFSSSYLRNYTMFFNASVQSFKGLYRNVKNAPVRTIASMVAEPIALGLMMPMINQMLYAVLDDDEKDRNGVKDPYLELPEYERRYNLCIYAGKGRFVKIPIAVEGRAFYGLGDIAASYTYKKDLKESRSLTLDIANQLAQIVPVGSFLESSATSGDSKAFLTSLGSTFLPSTISAAIELIGNRDWKGQPIYNDATYMENAPAWKKAYKGTNELFLWANKKANAWTNDVDPGNENMKGSTAADVVTNPFVWEQVFNSYVGGMGTFATRMGVTIKHALSKDSEVEVKDIPFIRSLLYTPSSQTSLQRTKSKWYNYKDEVETTNYNLTQLKHDSKDPMIGLKSAAAYFKYINSPKSEEVNIVNDYNDRIKKLNKILKVVTDEETRKDIESEKDRLMMEAVDKLDKLE